MSSPFKFSLTGTIRDAATGQPLHNLLLRAYDKDFFRNQLLGSNLTDENGRFEIRFSREDFTGPLVLLERHPDIFVQVYDNNNQLIFSTEKSVIVDAGRHSTLDLSIPYKNPEEEIKDVSYILGTAVNMKYLPQLSVKDLVAAYKLQRNPLLPVENSGLIERVFPHIKHKHTPGDDCGEGLGATIRLLLKERNAEADLADADDFAAGTNILHFYTAKTVTQYTFDAGNADRLTGVFATLPAVDENFNFPVGAALIGVIRANLADLQAVNILNSVVAPTYVQKIGLMAEYALDRYINPAFNFIDPRNGAPLFEMRIRTQPGGLLGQTSATWNYVEVGIQNSDTLHFGTVPHEMFHQVQYRYNGTTTRSGIYGILREGGARYIEDSIYDAPNRYVLSASGVTNTGIFPSPHLSLLDQGGTSTAINYAAGLFWKYIAEHHSPNTNPANEPAIGIESYRILLEEAAGAAAGYTIQAVRNARNRMPWYGTFDQFSYYDAAATELNSHETTYGNYLLANFIHGLIAPGDADFDQRFDYLEDDDAAIATVLNAQSVVSETISISQGSASTRMVNGQNPYAAKYYTVTPDNVSVPRMVRINFAATSGMTDPIIQIIRLGAGDTIIDIHRSDRPTYSKTINMDGLSKLVVIIGSKENGGNYTIHFDEQASASDVMVTRWNSRVATEYEADPKGWAWTWISPDIIVDTNNDGMDDVDVLFGQDNRLKVRLRNRGNLDVNNIQIDFWYQKATPYLSSAAWAPVQNSALITQQLTMQTLPAGTEDWFGVDWCPVDDGTHHNHYCVKAVVTCAGDPNTDNKMAFRNFSNVGVPDPDIDLVTMLRYSGWPLKEQLIHIIPRDKNYRLVLREPEIFPAIKHTHYCDGCHHHISIPVPDNLVFAKLRIEKANLKKWDGRNTRSPQESGAYYLVDPLTLPPGIHQDEIITIAHISGGNAIGGVSYKITKQ